MTTDNFCFYLQNRLIQNSQTGGQQYSDTSPFSIPCLSNLLFLIIYGFNGSENQLYSPCLKIMYHVTLYLPMNSNHVDIYELYVPNFYDILNRFSNSLEFAEKKLQRSDMSKSTLSLQLSWMKSTELQFDQKKAFTKS
jgi:hypothetical protein